PASAQAYGLTPAPPLFGLPAAWARSFEEARRYAPANATNETDRGARLVALAKSSVDDDVALAQARTAGTQEGSPKRMEVLSTVGDSLIAVRYLLPTLTPWNQSPAIYAAMHNLLDKNTRV